MSPRARMAVTMGLRMRGTWVYLSIKTRAEGTLWSPRCTAEEPIQPPPTLRMVRERMSDIACATRGADCWRLSPWPVSRSRYSLRGSRRSCSVRCHNLKNSNWISRQRTKLWST
eukprot:Amastigsp_a176678_22.p5 type:complete len:114 gc:universal Amastigsp_a176678_22:998-657(-)